MATKLKLTPSQRFSNFVRVVKIFAIVCGANIFRPDYRLNALTWFVIGVIATFFIFTSYTMYVGVVIDNDYTKILQLLCVTGSAIQGATKLVNGLYHASLIRSLIAEILTMYEEYECKDQRYIKYLEHTLSLIKRAVFSLLNIYSIQTIGVLAVPLFYHLLLGQQIDIIALLVPGIDKHTDFGFYTYQFYHFCVVGFASFGNFANDTLMVLLIVHVPLMKNILKLKFDALDEVLKEYPRDVDRTEPLLREIFQWHQKSTMFAQNCTDTFFWVIFVQIFASTLAIICIMVCQFLGVWPAAPVYMMYCFAIMYMFCGLGNLIEISNDDLTRIIYDCNWYELTVTEQKMILLMLRKSQQAPTMTVGGFMPLSMNSALQLTKTIYTAAMILNEFVN
ncbi:odorant receptor 67d-like [Musca domestica]|uniref:Odorant receptor n=1 Tax=Musca domestica TaxID=7370 RepID=A0A9J7DCI1_MUSDO|nr:odorant receptor 67d-like [Musca domestica]